MKPLAHDRQVRSWAASATGAFFVAVALLPLCADRLLAGISIFRPKLGVPAFVETNGFFYVEVVSGRGLSAGRWHVKLANDLREWTSCTVERAEYGNYVCNNTRPGWRLKVRAPRDIPPELFRLVVTPPTGGSATNNRAVQIVPDLNSSFYILHFADPQIVDRNASAANGQNGGYGSAQEMQWAATAFNLINPRFMLHTGDEVENGDVNSEAKYGWYVSALESFSFPTLITRGNNDRGDFGRWQTTIGQSTYSMTLGSFYIGINDASASGRNMLAWMAKNYSASFRNRNVKYRLIGQHFNAGSDKQTPCAFSSPRGKNPDLMLVGHNHVWETLQQSPYRVLSSGPAFNYGRAAFFEFTNADGKWTCTNMWAHGSQDMVQPFGDRGEPTVSCTFTLPNDGSAQTNTATVKNSLGLDFGDGRLRFLMRRSQGGCAVTGGEKLAEYSYARGSNTAVVVKVNIARNATTTVGVSWTQTASTAPDESQTP